MISAALVGYGYWGKIIRKYIEQSECFMLQLIYSPNITENGIFQSMRSWMASGWSAMSKIPGAAGSSSLQGQSSTCRRATTQTGKPAMI